jgi:hypothetical protein
MQGFTEWARRHCTVFGLLDAKQVAMVASWQPTFDLLGWTAAELHEATTWLAANAPPRFPSEHLPALRQRVLDVRARRDLDDQMLTRREEGERLRQESQAAGGLAALAAKARRRGPGGEAP